MAEENNAARYLAGVRAGIPVIFGFIPVGIAYAVMARQAGFTIGQTCGMSLAVFAGASQMMAIGLFTQGSSIAVMILATFILNLRHLMMGTCIMERMRGGGLRSRLLAAFGVTDESFAIFTTTAAEQSTLPYFWGLVTVTYASWNTGTAIGAVASGFLPDILSASLGIALYAMFIALLTPNLRHNGRLGALAVMTAVVNTLLTRVMAASWAMILAALICAFAGVFFVDLQDEGDGRDE